MVSMQDFFPTLDPIIGATMPTDRYRDGMDQSGFFLVKKKDSNREHLITFVNNELKKIFNVEMDPREQINIIADNT